VAANTIEVDGVSGATVTSTAIKAAVTEALTSMGFDPASYGVAAPVEEATPAETPAPEPEKPKFTPSPFSNFDFNFHKHADDQTSTEATAQESNSLGGFENPPENSAPDSDGFNDGSFAGDGFDDSFDNDGFGDDTFANDGFGDDSAGADDFGSNSFDAPDSEEEDDFGLGFGNKSISSDRPSSFENEGSKPSGGRFKKRK
ncbi:MAG: FMN-binding protein, partial [Lachnospiraceae bacterium]